MITKSEIRNEEIKFIYKNLNIEKKNISKYLEFFKYKYNLDELDKLTKAIAKLDKNDLEHKNNITKIFFNTCYIDEHSEDNINSLDYIIENLEKLKGK